MGSQIEDNDSSQVTKRMVFSIFTGILFGVAVEIFVTSLALIGLVVLLIGFGAPEDGSFFTSVFPGLLVCASTFWIDCCCD
jgi:hypothetical protein